MALGAVWGAAGSRETGVPMILGTGMQAESLEGLGAQQELSAGLGRASRRPSQPKLGTDSRRG